jgi:hypothetical protein
MKGVTNAKYWGCDECVEEMWCNFAGLVKSPLLRQKVRREGGCCFLTTVHVFIAAALPLISSCEQTFEQTVPPRGWHRRGRSIAILAYILVILAVIVLLLVVIIIISGGGGVISIKQAG